jgi:CTP synthase
VEICELADHPWYLGCQFHPEFKSKPMEPHPLFRAFIGAAVKYRDKRQAREEAPLIEGVLDGENSEAVCSGQ